MGVRHAAPARLVFPPVRLFLLRPETPLTLATTASVPAHSLSSPSFSFPHRENLSLRQSKEKRRPKQQMEEPPKVFFSQLLYGLLDKRGNWFSYSPRPPSLVVLPSSRSTITKIHEKFLFLLLRSPSPALLEMNL